MTEDLKAHEQRLLTQGRSDEPVIPEGGCWVVGAILGAVIWAVVIAVFGGQP